MNGHDEETYENKDLPTAFVPRETAEAFKKYVHDRLDKMGVPSNPEPEKNAEHGCRIEGRLNYIEQETAQLREALKAKDKEIQELRDRLPLVSDKYIDNVTRKYGE